MKLLIKYLFIFSSPILFYGQQVDQEAMIAAKINSVIYSGERVLEYWNRPEYSEMNRIFIKQIGYSNSIHTEIKTDKDNLNNINLNQLGNYNMLLVNVGTRSIAGNIYQIGDNNYSFDFAHDPNHDLNIDLLQEGNGHHFERYGSNSIGNDLQFKMTGDSQTLIVRNFQ